MYIIPDQRLYRFTYNFWSGEHQACWTDSHVPACVISGQMDGHLQVCNFSSGELGTGSLSSRLSNGGWEKVELERLETGLKKSCRRTSTTKHGSIQQLQVALDSHRDQVPRLCCYNIHSLRTVTLLEVGWCNHYEPFQNDASGPVLTSWILQQTLVVTHS